MINSMPWAVPHTGGPDRQARPTVSSTKMYPSHLRWKQGLCGCDWGKRRSDCIRVNPMTPVLKEGNLAHICNPSYLEG
jgi:hypothetical protein